MRFILGLLVSYCIRGKQRLLIATLSVIAVGCFIVLPAIALSLLALDVRRERLSRPPQPTVPVVVGLNYEAAHSKSREANLHIRILAIRHGLPLEPGTIIAQTPQGGERVDCGPVRMWAMEKKNIKTMIEGKENRPAMSKQSASMRL
ncbi:MAG TPA: PASTA domain-containing protein [Pyrinomonadaceae bacterium]|nr:PASTA domain-containing protein [Pyrinomonadaceae bacterium]